MAFSLEYENGSSDNANETDLDKCKIPGKVVLTKTNNPLDFRLLITNDGTSQDFLDLLTEELMLFIN